MRDIKITHTAANDQKRRAELEAAAACLAPSPIPRPPPDALERVSRRIRGGR